MMFLSRIKVVSLVYSRILQLAFVLSSFLALSCGPLAFGQGVEEKNIIGLNLNRYYLNLIPDGKVPYLIVDTKKWADARTFLCMLDRAVVTPEDTSYVQRPSVQYDSSFQSYYEKILRSLKNANFRSAQNLFDHYMHYLSNNKINNILYLYIFLNKFLYWLKLY